MNARALAAILRQRATLMRNADQEPLTLGALCDNAELLTVLARVVEGRPLKSAFGAPGDWGYSTPIGAALAEALDKSTRAVNEITVLAHELAFESATSLIDSFSDIVEREDGKWHLLEEDSDGLLQKPLRYLELSDGIVRHPSDPRLLRWSSDNADPAPAGETPPCPP